jgi:hypothetical protein
VWSSVALIQLKVAFAKAVFFKNVVCVKVESTYCISTLPNLRNAFAAGAQVTSDSLSTVCNDPCRAPLMKVIAQWAPIDVLKVTKALEVLCVQEGTEFCFPKLYQLAAYANVSESQAQADSGETPAIVFQIFCNPCMAKILTKLEQIFNDYLKVVAFSINPWTFARQHLELVCVRNPKGEYCINVLQRAGKAVPENQCSGLGLPGAAQTCSAECKNAISSVQDATGCCLGTFTQIMQAKVGAIGDITGEVEFDIAGTVKSKCGITIDVSCQPDLVIGKLVVAGIKWKWYSDHKDAFIAAVKADIAARAGVNIKKITVNANVQVEITAESNQFSTQAAGVQISYTVEPGPGQSGAFVSGQLSGNAFKEDPALSSTNSQAPVEARSDPTSSPQASSQSTSSTTANPSYRNSAAGRTVSLLALLLPAILLIVRLF